MSLKANSSLQFIITKKKLINKQYLNPDVSDGALVCFRGYVRNNNPYKKLSQVVAIDYFCYLELAQKEGERILAEAKSKYNLGSIFCAHRIGLVLLQEASIHLELTSAHRTNVFDALYYIMNCIKKTLPVWKQEITSEGKKIWT